MSKATIKLKDYSQINEELTVRAANTITPGMLVSLHTDGTAQPHGTASGNALAMFAVEDELQGKSIDETYAAASPCQVWVPRRGDIVYAILKDGNDVAIGDFLESGGDGRLQRLAAPDSTADIATARIVAQAIEAVDTSDSSGATSGTLVPHARIKVRVL